MAIVLTSTQLNRINDLASRVYKMIYLAHHKPKHPFTVCK
jgi:hypothetical protein